MTISARAGTGEASNAIHRQSGHNRGRHHRFARSLRQLANALSEFDALGVQFVSLHDGVDTSTPNLTDGGCWNLLASIAEFERELIRGRVRSGIAATR